MQMLKAKLYMLKQQENAEKLSDIRGDVKEIGWGNQIRSYVLQPYTMVKDLRTGEETGNVANVLDGGLDPFISAYPLAESGLPGPQGFRRRLILIFIKAECMQEKACALLFFVLISLT